MQYKHYYNDQDSNNIPDMTYLAVEDSSVFHLHLYMQAYVRGDNY